MDAETMGKAKEKADMMLQLIGYPDWLLDPKEVDAYFRYVQLDIGVWGF